MRRMETDEWIGLRLYRLPPVAAFTPRWDAGRQARKTRIKHRNDREIWPRRGQGLVWVKSAENEREVGRQPYFHSRCTSEGLARATDDRMVGNLPPFDASPRCESHAHLLTGGDLPLPGDYAVGIGGSPIGGGERTRDIHERCWQSIRDPRALDIGKTPPFVSVIV